MRFDGESDGHCAAVERALRSDPELEEQLRPLLDGRYGDGARRLFLARFAARLERGTSASNALVPALADALREARGETDDPSLPPVA